MSSASWTSSSSGSSTLGALSDAGSCAASEVDSLQARMAAVNLGWRGNNIAADEAGPDVAEGSSASVQIGDVGAADNVCCPQWPRCFCCTRTERQHKLPAPPPVGQKSLALPPLPSSSSTGPLAPDLGLVHLRGLSSLEALDLEACVGLRDGDVAHLSALGKLRQLNLAGCVRVEGTTLHMLADAAGNGGGELQELCLDDCPRVGAPALAGIATLSSLRTLSLRGCALVDDAGLQALAAGLGRLTGLSLFSAAGVTSRGLHSLSRMPRLRSLQLSHCWNVDDEGLMQLARCRDLAQLNLQHCWKVSEAALQAMQQECPNLDIVIG